MSTHIRPQTYILCGLCLVIPTLYTTAVFDFTLHPRQMALQLGLLLTCFLFIINPPSRSHSPILLPLTCFTLWSVLSVCWAINPLEGLQNASRQVTFFLLVYIVLHTKQKEIHLIFLFSGIAAFLVSCIGIAQYFGWGFSNIPTVGNPSATFGYRNFAAIYTITLLPISVVFALQKKDTPSRTFWGATALLMGIFLAYTRTRGAWLGLMAAIAITLITCFILHMPRPSRKHFVPLLGGLLLVLLLGRLPDQMTQTGKFGFDERKTDVTTTLTTAFSTDHTRGRLIMWQHTSEMIFDHFIFGVGLGSWQFIYPEYDKGHWITHNAAPQRPHNDFLWTWAETGTIGLGLYLWFLFAICQSLILLVKKEPTAQVTAWAVGLTMGLLAYLGHSFFSFPKERIAPSFVFYLCVGALAALSTQSNPKKESSRLHWGLTCIWLCTALTFSYYHFQFDSHYRNLHNAWRQQDWHKLISEADAAGRWGAFNHRTLLLKGLAQQNQNNHAAATMTYLHAQKYHPNAGHAALAHAYSAQNKWQEAHPYQQRESQLYPNTADVWLDLAHIEEQMGNPDQAIATLQEAIAHLPQSTTLYQRLGELYQRMRRFTDALRTFDKAQKQDPKNFVIQNNMGVILVQLKRYDEAEKAYLKAINHNPAYARAYHNLGDLYRLQSRAPQARQAYESFIDTWQGNPKFIQLAKDKIQALETIPTP